MKSIKLTYLDADFDTLGPILPNKIFSKVSEPDTHIAPGAYMFAIADTKSVNYISGESNRYVKNIFGVLHNHQMKEKFYIQAIQNLYKKAEFLELSNEFDNDVISEEEFECELKLHKDKYLIKINPEFEKDSFPYIIEIVNHIKRQFTHDEVSELFSIPIDKINHIIEFSLENYSQSKQIKL